MPRFKHAQNPGMRKTSSMMTLRARSGALLSVVLLAGCSGPSAPTSPVPAASTGPTASATPRHSGTWVQQENARPGTKGWRITKLATDAQITGFARQSSITAGQAVPLAVRSATPWAASVLRLGHYDGIGARRIWTSPSQPARTQPRPALETNNRVSAAGWKDSLTVATDGWLPGSYLVVLTDAAGRGHYIPLTVRTSGNAGRVVLMAATSTYQAYNDWGGYSLYRGPTPASGRAHEVSFDRPYGQDGARFALGYEHPIVFQAEKLGLDLGYTTSLDLERRPAELTGAAGLVSPGHDEYWSVGMRGTAERLRDAGTNLAFLGANAVYWRIRFSPDGRTITGYKSDAAADPVKGAQNTNLWRLQRPESSLVGQLYECFPAKGDLRVEDPTHWLFAGTGAKRGSTYPGLVGVEIDRAYPFSPATTRILAHSPVACADRGTTHSDLTVYTAASGAAVVSVGTMNWRSGISSDAPAPAHIPGSSVAFATRVTRNLLTGMARGPIGKDHPQRANLAQHRPSASTGTGTGGAVTGVQAR